MLQIRIPSALVGNGNVEVLTRFSSFSERGKRLRTALGVFKERQRISMAGSKKALEARLALSSQEAFSGL
jgi:hypothetical protein